MVMWVFAGQETDRDVEPLRLLGLIEGDGHVAAHAARHFMGELVQPRARRCFDAVG